MKATGEVMAIAATFEMALMKAVRGAEISLDTLNLPKFAKETDENLWHIAVHADRRAAVRCVRAFKAGRDRGEDARG